MVNFPTCKWPKLNNNGYYSLSQALLYLEELALGNSMSPNNVLGSEPTLGNCISEKTQYRRTELYAGFYSWRTTF